MAVPRCCADIGTPDSRRPAAASVRRGGHLAQRGSASYALCARFRPRASQQTFETAITWDRSKAFTTKSKRHLSAPFWKMRKGEVTCRFTHVSDGPAPYFSFHALGRHGALLEQWQAIKNAASDALIAAGGTITHHHAVGRDHRPWYDRQRPELFAAALRAAKRELDPQGLLNPGVLIDP